MRCDDRGVRRRTRLEIVGIREPADVVAHDGASRKGCARDRCAPGVDAQRHVETSVQGLDGRDHAVELLLLVDIGTGPGLHAADVEQIGAVGHSVGRMWSHQIDR